MFKFKFYSIRVQRPKFLNLGKSPLIIFVLLSAKHYDITIYLSKLIIVPIIPEHLYIQWITNKSNIANNLTIVDHAFLPKY